MVSYCELLWWPVVRRRATCVVNTFFKRHLLLNHMANCKQNVQKWTLVGTLSKLFKEFNSIENCCWQPLATNKKSFKDFLVRNIKADIYADLSETSSSELLTSLFKLLPWGPYWPCLGVTSELLSKFFKLFPKGQICPSLEVNWFYNWFYIDYKRKALKIF